MHPDRAIDRFLSEGRAPLAESVRAHVAGCARCRARYDGQVLLLRALAGSVRSATPAEDARMVQRALAGAGATSVTPAAKEVSAPFRWDLRRLVVGLSFAAAAVALVVLAGRFLQSGPAARLVTAHAVMLDGKPATAGAALAAGAHLEVPRAGLAELALDRGGRVKIFPGTRVVVGARGELVQLEAGRIWCQVDHNGRPFAVRTDQGEARVLGTSFVVEHADGDETEVRVLEGTVAVEDTGHRGTVKVHRGQKTRLRPQAPPAPPRSYAEHDRSDWAAGLREVVEKIGRGVGKAFHDIKDSIEKESR
ncbi:MAG: hypothetical protein NVS2B9_12500 [Myxococcales bacterium]